MLRSVLPPTPHVVLDVVVPTYRCDVDVLRRIVALRASVPVTTKFWLVVDSVDPARVARVRALATAANARRPRDGHYFVQVIANPENRGASCARNIGYNYSTADWVLFIDDDVTPAETLLDAYVGAARRYPEASVFVGNTTFPPPCTFWTEAVVASNITFFYGVATRRQFPPWGVTAQLMVAGSRHQHTVQFSTAYPKTGGGEDVDFVMQVKALAATRGRSKRVVVAVPGAEARHPWWNGGQTCYGQICGWAWGDSLCLLKWPGKTFLVCPNWAEFLLAHALVAAAVGRGGPRGAGPPAGAGAGGGPPRGGGAV